MNSRTFAASTGCSALLCLLLGCERKDWIDHCKSDQEVEVCLGATYRDGVLTDLRVSLKNVSRDELMLLAPPGEPYLCIIVHDPPMTDSMGTGYSGFARQGFVAGAGMGPYEKPAHFPNRALKSVQPGERLHFGVSWLIISQQVPTAKSVSVVVSQSLARVGGLERARWEPPIVLPPNTWTGEIRSPEVPVRIASSTNR